MSKGFPFRYSDLEYKHLNISQASELQNLLFNISSDNINDVKTASIPFFKNEISAHQFFLTFKNVVTFRPLLVSLCCQLLSLLSNELKSISTEKFQRQICLMFRKQYKILLTLYELQIISVENLTDRYLLPFENNLDLLKYFYPEITEKVPSYYSKHVQSEEVKAFLAENLGKTEEFKEKRSKGINENPVCQCIIENDFENFTKIANGPDSIDLNATVPFSLFESTDLVSNFSDDGMHFIEYAALFGTFQIFNYMVQNGIEITSNTMKAAIIGGNSEILQLLIEGKNKQFRSENFYDAVYSHQNEISEKIFNSKLISFSPEILIDIIPSYNLEYIINKTKLLTTDEYANKAEKYFLNQVLFIAVGENFPEVVEFLFTYRKFVNINYKFEEFYKMTLLNKAALCHHIEIIKVLLNQKGIDTTLTDAKILSFFLFLEFFFYFYNL